MQAVVTFLILTAVSVIYAQFYFRRERRLMKWQNRSRFVAVPLTLILLFILLFPFFVMISTMLKSGTDVYAVPPFWIPTHIEWCNFVTVWTQYDLASYFLASIIIAVGATAPEHAPVRAGRVRGGPAATSSGGSSRCTCSS